MTDGVRAAAERLRRYYAGDDTVYRHRDDDARFTGDVLLLVGRVPADDGEAERFSAWAFLRTVLERGAAIQQDYAAGNHGSYEVHSARMDAVARDFAEQLKPHLRRQSP